MLNIFIKSFNRAYYLDRCIQSILNNVFNGQYKITVLDDGTQSKYLNKIQQKYKDVVIIKSEYFEEKVKKISDFIDNKVPIVNMQIPAAFWKRNILASEGEYILVLEDDFWVTKPIDLRETLEAMKKFKMPFLKLFFFNNPKFICGQVKSVSTNINTIVPKFNISSSFIVKNVIINNKFKSFSILQRLGLLKFDQKFNYYTLYSVAGAIYNRKYYGLLWQNAEDIVNEDVQLINAYDYFIKNKKNYIIGCFKQDVVNTSFSSSATNMFDDIDFNVYHYNHELNEAWYYDNFSPLSGYPNDISDEEIISVLKSSQHIKINEWQKWKTVFLKHYTDIGIDNG